MCQSNSRMVDAAREQHPDLFEVSLRPRDDHREELAAHGIESHGIVCLDQSGETLWKHGDHDVSQADFAKGLATVLAKLQ